MRPTRVVMLCWIMILTNRTWAQVECNGWAELRGIRVDGELRQISTSLCIAQPGWQQVAETAHWRTRNPTYKHEDGKIICTGQLGLGQRAGSTLSFRQVVADAPANSCTIEIQATADGDLDVEGVYFFVKVPKSDFGGGTGVLLGHAARANFATTRPANDKHYLAGSTTGAVFESTRKVEVSFDQPREAIIQDDRYGSQSNLSVFFPLHTGRITSGQTFSMSCTIRVSGETDTSPVTVRIEPTKRGNVFAGMGGNFCWGTQSPVVPFFLDNLRVSWARVNMPLAQWQPEENSDPTTRPADELHPEIREALRIATELHRRKIPTMIAVWSAPPWAYQRQANQRRGGRIDPAKWDALARSIGSYLQHFKHVVGVEPELFSFNEPDIGINVLQSPQEHRDYIKLLGRHLASLGLRTKIILSDAHEPRPIDYVNPSLSDPEAMKYVGAVTYHSWNDRTPQWLNAWRDHARKANVPLFVAEGGTDPESHRYPAVWAEPWYAIDEAVMYVQCLSWSQPQAMLHWQLTPDYGMVRPGAEANDPMKLSQRWFQFKQLAQLSPPNAIVLEASSEHPAISVAALADADHPLAVLHLTNTDAARRVTIDGLPPELKKMRLHITDATRGMAELDAVSVLAGRIEMTIPAECFVTLRAN